MATWKELNKEAQQSLVDKIKPVDTKTTSTGKAAPATGVKTSWDSLNKAAKEEIKTKTAPVEKGQFLNEAGKKAFFGNPLQEAANKAAEKMKSQLETKATKEEKKTIQPVFNEPIKIDTSISGSTPMITDVDTFKPLYDLANKPAVQKTVLAIADKTSNLGLKAAADVISKAKYVANPSVPLNKRIAQVVNLFDGKGNMLSSVIDSDLVSNFARSEKANALGTTVEEVKKNETKIKDVYKQELDKMLVDRYNPNNSGFAKLLYGLQDAGPQTLIGVGLGMIPYAGVALAPSYYAALSASEQIQERGKVDSLVNIGIDTAGDMILGKLFGGLLKTPTKALTRTLQGFTTEGGTEVGQSLLKYLNDYRNADTEEQKTVVENNFKNYVKNGDMLLEFGIGGIIGAGVTAAAGGTKANYDNLSSQINSNIKNGEEITAIVDKLGVAKKELDDYVTANKKTVVKYEGAPVEGETAPAMTIETVKYDNGTYGTAISANLGNSELISTFEQSDSFKTQEEAILDAKDKIKGWVEQQNFAKQTDIEDLVKQLDAVSEKGKVTEPVAIKDNIDKIINDYLEGHEYISQNGLEYYLESNISEEQWPAIIKRFQEKVKSGEITTETPVAEQEEEISPELQEKADREWEDNPQYGDKVAELHQKIVELNNEIDSTSDKAKKAELKKEVEKINAEIEKINDEFVSKWKKIAKEESASKKPEKKTKKKKAEKEKPSKAEKRYPNTNPESGVKIFGHITGKTAKLDSIEISAAKRKSGRGSKYVKDFEKWAIDNGATRIEIDAYKGSTGFWEKMGYTLEENFPVIDGVKQDYKSGFKDISDKKVSDEIVIDSVNPSNKGVFASYSPEKRAEAKLANNISTLAESMGDKPEKIITIYRGAPSTQKEIVPGDFVTTNEQLAKDYAGNGIVLKKQVKLEDILDDKNEPLGEEYIYYPKKEATEKPKTEKPKKDEIKNPIVITTELDTEENIEKAKRENEVMAELEMSTPGRKEFIRDEQGYLLEIRGTKSTFPSWLPKELRLNSVIRPTLEHIYSGTMPTKVKEIRLYNLIFDKVNTGFDEQVVPEKEIDVSEIQFMKDVKEFEDTNKGIKQLDYIFDGRKLATRLEKTMKRLGLNFDVALYDKIFTGEMAKKVKVGAGGVQTLQILPEEAAGVYVDNRILLAKEAVRFTDYHELVHLISNNLQNIPAFSKYTKAELLAEAKKVYGDKYTDSNLEEVLARGFEDFVYRRKTFTGKLRSFFGQMYYQIRQILQFNKRTDLKSFYEDVLYSKAKEQTTLKPTFKKVGKETTTSGRRVIDFGRGAQANFLIVNNRPVTSVSEIEPAATPEELTKRIDLLNKVGQKNYILRRLGQVPRGAAGVFVTESGKKLARGVAKEGEVRLKQSYVGLSANNYMTVLAHELGHGIDAAINGGVTNSNPYKAFGDNLSRKELEQVRDELKAVTVDLVGAKEYASKPVYYNKPTELLARFFEKMFAKPGDLTEMAPLATELIERNQITHPIIADMLQAAAGTMDKGQAKHFFLADLKQTYIKFLGKTVGEQAYNDEIVHRSMLERGKYVIENFVKEKFKDVKDSPELLFRAAESIKVTKGGDPEFGTRDFATAKNNKEEADLELAGYKPLEDEGKQIYREIDGESYPVYWKQRYTPEEGRAIYDRLSPEGKKLIEDFTAARDEAKDYFNREIIKEANNIDSNIEGWVHHYFPQEKNVGASSSKLKFRSRTAGAKKQRTGAEGYIEDLQLNMTKALTDLESAKQFNEFIRRQFAAVTKPLLKGEKPEVGWVEVQGDVFKGAGTPQEKKMVIIKGNKRFVPQRNSYQMPAAIYERYKLYGGLVQEASKATQIMNDINRYWRVNILTHPGSAATNFLSGGVQYGSKVLTDFYTELLTGKIDMKQTRANVGAMVQTLMPKGWSESPDWIFGGDQSSFYGQFMDQPGIAGKAIDAYADKALKLYGAVERYWKKVITISEKGRTLKGLEEMTREGLKMPSDMERKLIAEINSQVDLYAYDYDNVPMWMENYSKSAGWQMVKPFAKYPYKYAKHIANMATSIFDRSIPWQERTAKLLAMSTIMAAYAMFRKWREEDRETPAGDENTPARFSPRGRLYIGKDDEGNELFLRTAKYPFFNLTDLGIALANRQFEEGKSIVSDLLGSLHPAAEIVLMTATNYENEYDRYLPWEVKVGNRLATFVPGYRVLNDVSQYFDPFIRKQTTFGQTFTKIIPTTNADLQNKLHGTIRTEQIPLEGEFKPTKKIKGLTRTTFDVELKSYKDDVLLSFLTGLYLRRINPKQAEALQIRTDTNSANKKASSLVETAAQDFIDNGGLKMRYETELIRGILGENPNPKEAKKIRSSFRKKVDSIKAGEELKIDLELNK